MNRIVRTMMTTTVVAAIAASFVSANKPSVYDRMTVDYETIRVALLNDTTDGIGEAADRVRQLAEDLDAESDGASSGVEAAKAPLLHELLPSIRSAAARLGEATSLEGAREAFGDLSKALVQYRQLTDNPVRVVAFCSMAQKVWLQPPGEIGNPYYGQSMARCGEIVSE